MENEIHYNDSGSESLPILTKDRAPSKALTPSDYTQDEIVSIIVGRDRKAFRLHKRLLQEQSPYFAARLKDCWDGEMTEVELVDATEQGFRMFVDWIYTRRLPEQLTDPKEKSSFARHLRAAYKVADQLMVPTLQNQLVNAALIRLASLDEWYSIKSLTWMWVDELTHTPLYKLVLKDSVRHFMRHPLRDEKMDLVLESMRDYPDAVPDLLKYINLWNRVPWPSVEEEDWCEFHVHAEDERCLEIPRRRSYSSSESY